MDEKYGGCEGPDAMYVKLISSDGHEFIVKREHALTSGTIKGKCVNFLRSMNDFLHILKSLSYAFWTWTICGK